MCMTRLIGGKLVIGAEKVTYTGCMFVDQLCLDVEDVELQTEDWNEEDEELFKIEDLPTNFEEEYL